ncbi:MAG TPA: 30S ribosomal protein S6 [Vicinamibacterales bacterium]|nr:30S ribosomal protein S6 [Vicinamibacterales bacterium]
MQRTYELVYVMRPDATEQQVADLHTQVEQIVGRMNGKIIDKNEAQTAFGGRRKLAYEIGHHKEGIYVLEVLAGDGAMVAELDRRLKNTEGLLRHLIVRVDESQIKAERARAKRTEESRRRRVARGLPPDRQPGEGPQGEDSDDSGDYESVEAEA